MCNRRNNHDANGLNHRGVVLLITLVILVILSTLGYTLSARVTARRHRDRYVIDYAQAQYACTSAMKYALVFLADLEPRLISRPNEPDFSDVFALSEPQYQALLAQVGQNVAAADDDRTSGSAAKNRWREEELKDVNTAFTDSRSGAGPAASATIPGPYGPPWPLAVQPVELEIGSVKVTIEIEDENAKYPLGWALIRDEQRAAEAEVGFRAFCEWMGYQPDEFNILREDLARVSAIRPFKMEFKPVAAPATPASPLTARSWAARARTATTAARRTARRAVISAADQTDRQNTEFTRLFHSSLIDVDLLTRPSVVSESRKESAMKYLGLWATRQVNVNTAPRHVLEAALTFGSVADAPKIADAIIRQRQAQPFSDIDEIKRGVLRYSDSIEKCKEFITTVSTVFTVRVTAVSGVAQKVVLTAVTKEGGKVKQIAVISD